MTFNAEGMSRRSLLGMIGTVAGAAAMYSAMSAMGLAQPSTWKGQLNLQGDAKGTSVLILGGGLAGMTAAFELRNAGYQVKVLEYREKAGGRCWTIRGGDTYTELGGFTQTCTFAEGNYINPGPWRIPSDHFAVLDYCKRFGVKLEPFIQVNYNAYLHNSGAFDGQPQRFKEISTDFRGHVAELLAKVVDQGALDATVTEDDAALLVQALKRYGTLNDDLAYVKSEDTSSYRGFAKPEGGGASGKPEPSEPHPLSVVLQSQLWNRLTAGDGLHFQSTIFQPVGGMDMIAKGFEAQVGDLITYNAKVTRIRHDGDSVTATWVPANGDGPETTETADYCICTIPFSVLGQIDHDFSPRMTGIIDGMAYDSAFKVGLEFKRRFWEQDEHIYGGISYTDLPITLISYPSTGFFSDGPGVLLGAYPWGAYAYQWNALPAEERVQKALGYGSQIHPQYPDEFLSGVAVGWHRVPWTMGCYGIWKDRDADYMDATAMDGRTLMAGEHISYLPAWMEGAILSSLDAVTRLHAIVTES
ncbi:MAG: flavin monoamine oxidase family protein [Paracoccus sp. (in: a-proteobacteria)]|uniref:flavin monoamine oxidase family protein n=1 Tax=Paracoccus sp. TaxID=267 RepID=UPI0026E066A8|nr:flavin monoamine oxidase family protein [Paracoccus sp. (in: a-proteobacteria)]MDO5620972.1 flavin monoamine oxidase family protein [Paracoccus sp. (in: a-proteobacteria)]